MKRKSLRSKIASEPELGKKLNLALFGKELHPLEKVARTFLAFPQAMDHVNAPPEFRREFMDLLRENILIEFCAALVKRDAPALRAVAQMLEAAPQQEAQDPLRAIIFNLKAVKFGEVTYDELAKLVHYTGDMDHFRRVVNESGYPIKKQVGGRPKTADE